MSEKEQFVLTQEVKWWFVVYSHTGLRILAIF